jgi:superfamily II DNA/RNA helicase
MSEDRAADKSARAPRQPRQDVVGASKGSGKVGGRGSGEKNPSGKPSRSLSPDPRPPTPVRFYAPKPKPAVSVPKAWTFLPPELARTAANLGFAKPTPVQKECLLPALAGESFQAVAPTGTGKTLVYLLPVWKSLQARGSKHRNLILVPTRELGYQVSQMLQQIDPRARDGLALCVGGHDLDAQKRNLATDWHTLIATPGRLLDVLDAVPDLLKSIRLLVLDEFDRLIDLGFEEQVGKILAKLPPKRQTLLFSATGENDALLRLPLGELAKHHVTAGKSAPLTETFYLFKSNKKKGDVLVDVLAATAAAKGQVLVFVANREKANHLNGLLRLRGFPAEALHGDRLQSERAQAYQNFKDGKVRVLVATDLAARGLDIPEVDQVVNFDLPRNFREYVHRSGRTARRARPGSCLSFAGPDDYLALRNLEKEFGGPLPLHPDYAQYDRWLTDARRAHETKVRIQKKADFLRREQGL